ncbi:MAG: arginase [Chloroflexi bacterium]|nr:arginase [Chloroflexota bacterium]
MINRPIRLLGIPIDLGQSRRGVDMGPYALRYASLQRNMEALGYLVHDSGNLDVPVVEEIIGDRDLSPQVKARRHLAAVAAISTEIYQTGAAAVSAGEIPLFLGGDHSVAIGTIGGVSAAAEIGLLWIDAHGDFNTPETSPSGNIHGMPLAALLGHGLPELVNVGRPGAKLRPDQVVMIGIRDLDPLEKVALKQSGITVFTMRHVDESGAAQVARDALQALSRFPRWHVSLDMDVMDPDWAPGVGTPVPGGLSYREAHLIMEILAESGRVASADVVEINPILDERNATAELAVALLASLFGKMIL